MSRYDEDYYICVVDFYFERNDEYALDDDGHPTSDDWGTR